MSTKDSDASICPYCEHRLKREPKRKTQCPHCSQPIYVKRFPNEPERRLMREEEAECANAAWVALQLDRYPAPLGSELLNTASPETRKSAWWQMTVRAMHHGQNFTSYAVEARKAELEACRNVPDVSRVRITGAKNACPNCKRLHGMVMNISIAEQHSPLPCRKCQRTMETGEAFCRCYYEIVFDDE